MDIVKTFGRMVADLSEEHPDQARKLLLAGWRAQRFMLGTRPDKRLPPSRQTIARVTMEKMIDALAHPDNSAAVSLFAPSELIDAAGITPFSVETLSAFITGTRCEQAFLRQADDLGMPDTLCSYHRTFLGALSSGLVAPPRFALYTNVACDGNLITFPCLHDRFNVPSWCIDVPYDKTDEAVRYVEGQIREARTFVEDIIGRRIADEALCTRTARSARTARSYVRMLKKVAQRRLPSDMTSEMYAVFASHVLLGSEESFAFARMLERESQQALPSNAKRLVWLHLIPNMQKPVVDALSFNDRAFVTACDLAADALLIDVDPSKPFEAMARRMVHSAFNGSVQARVERALDLARMTNADGAVLFAQWGCTATLGAAPLIKRALEDAGLPCLVLDGDGCDPANTSDGQASTRLEAFLEMLESARTAEMIA